VSLSVEIPLHVPVLFWLLQTLSRACPGGLDNGVIARATLGYQAGHYVHQGHQAVLVDLDLPPVAPFEDVVQWGFRFLFNDFHTTPKLTAHTKADARSGCRS
jgi:hypothetical protein